MLRAHNPLLFLKAQGPFGPSKSLSNILRFVFSERDETPQLKHDLRSDFNLTNSPLVVGEKLRWAMDFDKNIFSEKRYEILRTKISSESLRSANDYCLAMLGREGQSSRSTDQLENAVQIAKSILTYSPEYERSLTEAELAFRNFDKLQATLPFLQRLNSANDPLNISGVSEFLAESDRIVESMERSPIGMILLRQSQVSTLLDSLKQPSLGRLLKGVGRR